MAQRTGLSRSPSGYVAVHGSWPDGPFQASAPDTARYAAAIAQHLHTLIRERGCTRRDVAARIGISRSTLYAIMAGQTYPDFHTLVKAEEFFGTPLWPSLAPRQHPIATPRPD